MICSALSGKEPGDINVTNESRDINATKKCLGVLDIGKDGVSNENFVYRLECEDSDTTYKFLLPIAGAFGKTCMYSLRGNLVFTSMDQFYKVLRTHGVKREEIRPDLIKVTGQLTAGTFIFPGVSDGQALSGLLMALPLLKEKSAVMVEKKPQSEMYVDMTINVMKRAGIQIEVLKDQNGLARIYRIPGGQKYDLGDIPPLEGDWELAAYWLTGAAISGGTVKCSNLNTGSLQGDRRILRILELFGAGITEEKHVEADTEENGEEVFWSDITVRGGKLKGINIDASDIPDLLAHVILLASAADGVSIIKNAVNLQMSQDRVRQLIQVMSGIGAEVTEVPDGLLIAGSGGGTFLGGRIATRNDYRIAMMGAIVSGICRRGVILEHADIVERTYPQFFDELERLKQNN